MTGRGESKGSPPRFDPPTTGIESVSDYVEVRERRSRLLQTQSQRHNEPIFSRLVCVVSSAWARDLYLSRLVAELNSTKQHG